MTTEDMRVSLGRAILAMRQDNDADRVWLNVRSRVSALLDSPDSLKNLKDLLEENDSYVLRPLDIFGGDIIILVLVYIIERHLLRRDCSWVIPSIRQGPIRSANDKVRFAAHHTLQMLGDPLELQARDTILRILGVSVAQHEELGILTMIRYIAQGCSN